MRRIRVLQLAALLLLLPGPGVQRLVAQDGGDALQRWDLTHLRGGWCLAFLMSPEEARNQLPDEFQPLAAVDVPGVHPALLRTVREDPGHADWVPSRVCFYQFDTIQVDGRRTFADRHLPELNRTQVIGLWGIAGREAARSGEGPLFYVKEFRTRDGGLQATARRAYLRVDRMDVALGRMPDSEEHRWQYGFGKTILTWDGHPAPDSTAIAGPDSTLWAMRSLHGGTIHARLMWSPGTVQYMFGAVSIQGKDDLAKSLGASPIRMVGPLHLDGNGELLFFR